MAQTEETRAKVEEVSEREELEKKRKEYEELEDWVRYCYLTENKSIPAKDLLGVVSRKVTCIDAEDNKEVFHVVVTITQADYDRITSDKKYIEYTKSKHP